MQDNTLALVRSINRFCSFGALICVALGAAISIGMIRAADVRETFSRMLATVGVLFLASLLTMAVNSSLANFGRREGSGD